ncbi:MAG: pilus assembly protein [Verrucomicrobia bacterium]|nr:MAG: pilus assembly protein [Verrucomicrobiota bacterium]
MAKTVVIDSGAIVAALRLRDQYHAWARAHFQAETEPFVTCEAVLSESFFLLEKAPGGKEALCGLLERAIINVDFSFAEQMAETLRLLRRYQDTPMSFADACLVRMAEQAHDAVVFTTDTDFRTYRKNGRQMIPLIMPE